MIRSVAVFAVALAAGCKPPVTPKIDDPTATLRAYTQQLFDAVTAGDATVWSRLLADDVVYTAEDGTVKSKRQLVDEVKPLPPQISGKLALSGFEVRWHGDVAVTRYAVDEQETYFGQALTARYLETDTWIRTGADWRLVAAQALAVKSDPPERTLADDKLDEYVGVYTLTPEVTYTIRRDGSRLVGQRSHRDPEPLRVEVADVLFVPGAPRLRKIFARDAAGHVTGFVERRESWDIRWQRAK